MYTERFLSAHAELLAIEGGFSNDPNDAGGATNHGISLRFARRLCQLDRSSPIKYGSSMAAHWLRLLDVDGDEELTIEDVRRWTPEISKEIYWAEFWRRYRCDDLPGDVAQAHFFNVVNMNPGRATSVLQRAVNRVLPRRLVIDGQIGPNTIEGVRLADERDRIELRRRMVSELCTEYHKLATGRNAGFASGWFYRAASQFIH